MTSSGWPDVLRRSDRCSCPTAPLSSARPRRAGADRPYGLDVRPRARPYLNLPPDERGSPPRLALADRRLRRRPVADAVRRLIPYDIIAPFWSDGAGEAALDLGPGRRRRSAVAPDGDWAFPAGTVFVKHFEIATDEARRARSRPGGGWRPDCSCATRRGASTG